MSDSPNWEIMTRKEYLGAERVGCPRCGVPAPEPCHMGAYGWERSKIPHPERVQAAGEAGVDLDD